MNISFAEEQQSVKFIVSGYGDEYESVLRSLFYTKEGESYVKLFPSDTRYLEQIKSNYMRLAPEMFAQFGYIKPTPWAAALLEVAERLDHNGIPWWLTGSCAAALRGVDLCPHDVDIMLESAHLEQVRDIMADCTVEPIIDTGGWVTRYFGVAFLGARIDLAFDPSDRLDHPEPNDSGPYARQHLEEVRWRGRTVRVPPLELQLASNRRRGRMDRVRAIMNVTGGRA